MKPTCLLPLNFEMACCSFASSEPNYRWDARKPFYLLRFSVLEPKQLMGHSVAGRLYCTPKALWKLNWFLRDFGYDADYIKPKC